MAPCGVSWKTDISSAPTFVTPVCFWKCAVNGIGKALVTRDEGTVPRVAGRHPVFSGFLCPLQSLCLPSVPGLVRNEEKPELSRQVSGALGGPRWARAKPPAPSTGVSGWQLPRASESCCGCQLFQVGQRANPGRRASFWEGEGPRF
jgi:hypothetical protein